MTYQPPIPVEEAGRRLRAYPALVAACRAAHDDLDIAMADCLACEKSRCYRHPILEDQLRDALAAAGESKEESKE